MRLGLFLYHCQSHFVDFILVLGFLLSKWAVSENSEREQITKSNEYMNIKSVFFKRRNLTVVGSRLRSGKIADHNSNAPRNISKMAERTMEGQ